MRHRSAHNVLTKNLGVKQQGKIPRHQSTTHIVRKNMAYMRQREGYQGQDLDESQRTTTLVRLKASATERYYERQE